MTSRQPDDSKYALRADEHKVISKPNAKTVASMLDAREIAEAHRARFSSAEDLFNELENGVHD